MVVEQLDDLTVGQRVARCRKARGMSQEVLAHLLGRSPSWLTKVERGERQLDRMSLMVEIARALEVDLTEITGQPYRPITGGTTHATVPALRRVLLSYDGHDGDPSLPDGVDPIPVLRARLHAVNELRHDAAYDRLGDCLPAVLEDIHRACVTLQGHDREQALELLVDGCHCARSMLRMLGYVDLAWIAVKRAGQAAARLGDPLLQAANVWNRVEVLFATGAASTGVELALAAIDELDADLGTAPPEHLSLLGIMHLKAAWGSAYVGDERQARIHALEAEQAAALIGGDRNDFGTVFGPTNLTIHRIGLAMELGDAPEALRLAASIDPRAVPYRERRARLHLDLARAHAQFRRQDLAIGLLLESERAAPNYLRNHPVAREIVTGMMHRPRATSTDLRALAVKVGAC
jgi:transcriptional regulator with XRE-family HTH domain